MKVIPSITVLVVLLLVQHARAQEVTGSYRVRVSDAPLAATVEATIPIKDGRLFMAAWGADHLPAGWASFLRHLQIRDEQNRLLSGESKPNGVWQVANNFTGTARIAYEIDLAFTKEKWPYGNEQAGSFHDNALFLVSKALFVISDAPGSREVTFGLPPGWKVSTPWRTARDQFTFVADDNNDLINNSLVLGSHREFVFSEGNFTLVLALLGSMENQKGLIAPALQKIVQNYGHIFDKTPRSKYLMTVFYADVVDAEAYGKSAAFTERDTLTRNNLIRWGNTLAHEFFHAWNGHAINGEDYATSQWFSEGFTEYFANLALVQTGLIGKQLFIKKVENHLGLYQYFKASPAFDGVTLKEAGSRKGRNRLGVYSGGWAVAFCLDVLIRDETNNRKSLADFMRLMYERFGLTGRKYKYGDIVSAASETAGRDLSSIFQNYVEGKATLSVQDYLTRIGFEGYAQGYDGEFFIEESPTMNSKQRSLQRSILTGR